uniref:Uncharacterized protein n=1 Tax=Globodera rostochiensis TaxID=31243 RepID=A0A914I8K4_GLORO
MSHGSNDSVLEVVKNKLLQAREEADKAHAEVERLKRELMEEREKRKLPEQKLKYAQNEAEEAKTELVLIRQQISEGRAAREKAERELGRIAQFVPEKMTKKRHYFRIDITYNEYAALPTREMKGREELGTAYLYLRVMTSFFEPLKLYGVRENWL